MKLTSFWVIEAFSRALATALLASVCCEWPGGTMVARLRGSPSWKFAVATALEATHTGLEVYLRATSAEQMIAAAAPSLTGQISYRRSGQLTGFDLSTSSTEKSCRKR